MTNKDTRKNTLQRVNEAEDRIEDLSNVVKFLTDELVRVEKDHAGSIRIITDELVIAKNHIESMERLWLKPWWKRLFVRFK